MKKSKKLSAPFELVAELTWIIYGEEDRAFLLYLQKYGVYHVVEYGEIVTKLFDRRIHFPCPIFISEIYYTKVFLANTVVAPFAENLLRNILSGDVANPTSLPFTYGGTFKHKSPLTYTPLQSH